MTDTKDKLIALFIEAARAHHKATGGANPEWAKWYAEYLIDKIPGVLEIEFNQDDLEATLEALHRKHTQEAPDTKWPRFYAEHFLEGFSDT